MPATPERVRKVIAGTIGAIITFTTVVGLSLELKKLLAGILILFGIGFEIFMLTKKNKPSNETDHTTLAPTIRWSVWGGVAIICIAAIFKEIENRIKPPEGTAKNIYYMVVLDASKDMKEPFDGYASKWIAVRTAFQDFYVEAHKDSNYGLVVLGGQNPQEKSVNPCSLPTVPLIPLVSENGRALPHRKLTLPKLQEQIEGQQPQGGGSLSRAFFLAKNQLESLPMDISKVIVLIVNASDTCEGKIDWDTLASEIELVNKTIAVHKELILLDVEASRETVAFAKQLNGTDDTTGTYNTYVQVVQNYYQLELSISYMIERIKTDIGPSQITPTNVSESGGSKLLSTAPSGEDLASSQNIVPTTTKSRKVFVVIPSTLTPTLTPTFTSSPTFTLTFTPTFTFTATFTSTPTLTCTPTTPAPIIVYPTTAKPKKDDSDVSVPPPDTCCVHCGSDSQPCGNSCISLEYTCHITGGCACP